MVLFNFLRKKNNYSQDSEITNPRIAEEVLTKRFFIEGDLADGDKLYGMTEAGQVRENNEDFFMLAPQLGLSILADGMGGHNAGEIASQIATQCYFSYFKQKIQNRKFEKDNLEQEIQLLLTEAFEEANSAILQLADENPLYRGMGTTMITAFLQENQLYLSHIGDVRAYLFHQDELTQLTEDHSVVWELFKEGKITKEEARQSKIKNQITKALGIGLKPDPSFYTHSLTKGDKLMLCSDGLWDMLPDEEIGKIIRQDNSAQTITKNLVEAANKAGGYDNITVITYLH